MFYFTCNALMEQLRTALHSSLPKTCYIGQHFVAIMNIKLSAGASREIAGKLG